MNRANTRVSRTVNTVTASVQSGWPPLSPTRD